METIQETALQFWWFGCVGTVNTVLDFWLFNRLTRQPWGWRRLPASLASTTAGMAFGFSMNLWFVFQPHDIAVVGRALRFLWVTAISCYVIQSIIIVMGTHVFFRAFRSIAQWTNDRLPSFGAEMVEKNLVKGAAVTAGMLWSFLWYKFYVFAE